MQAAVIAPLSMLEKYSSQSRFHMALAHLVVRDPSYRSFYRSRSEAGEFVLMDNGVVETGEAFDMANIIRAADMIKASEIVLPDRLNDAAGTVALTTDALIWLRAHRLLGKYRLLAVPQGSTALLWLWTLGLFTGMPEINALGISKFAHPLVDGGRERLLEVMEALALVDSNRDYHLLGCWEDPLEILRVRRANPWVRSVDSCIPVLSGLHNVPFPDPLRECRYSRPDEEMNFYATDDPHPEVTAQNVRSFVYWAQGD